MFFIETFKYKSERLSNFTGVCTIGITIMFDGLSLILALKSLSKRYVADQSYLTSVKGLL